MTTIAIALLILLLGGGNPGTPAAISPAPTVTSASQDPAASPEALVASMTSYEIGILRKGPKWASDTPAKLDEAIKKKEEPWRKAVTAGNLVGALRVIDPHEIVAILFFKNQSAESMKEMAGKAPAVTSGLLTAEVQKVWGTRGLGAGLPEKLKEAPKTPLKKETYYLVITTKGKNWSEKSDDPATRKATTDQIKYLYGAFKSGKMKYHCSLEDISQATRSIVIFKTGSEKEALDIMNDSPLVKNGWLTARARKVTVADGVLP
jgi:uncharacterized protein YciI